MTQQGRRGVFSVAEFQTLQQQNQTLQQQNQTLQQQKTECDTKLAAAQVTTNAAVAAAQQCEQKLASLPQTYEQKYAQQLATLNAQLAGFQGYVSPQAIEQQQEALRLQLLAQYNEERQALQKELSAAQTSVQQLTEQKQVLEQKNQQAKRLQDQIDLQKRICQPLPLSGTTDVFQGQSPQQKFLLRGWRERQDLTFVYNRSGLSTGTARVEFVFDPAAPQLTLPCGQSVQRRVTNRQNERSQVRIFNLATSACNVFVSIPSLRIQGVKIEPNYNLGPLQGFGTFDIEIQAVQGSAGANVVLEVDNGRYLQYTTLPGVLTLFLSDAEYQALLCRLLQRFGLDVSADNKADLEQKMPSFVLDPLFMNAVSAELRTNFCILTPATQNANPRLQVHGPDGIYQRGLVLYNEPGTTNLSLVLPSSPYPLFVYKQTA